MGRRAQAYNVRRDGCSYETARLASPLRGADPGRPADHQGRAPFAPMPRWSVTSDKGTRIGERRRNGSRGGPDRMTSLGERLIARRSRACLEPDRARHLRPGPILDALEASQVDRGDRERAVIEEGRHRLDRLTRVAAQLGRGVAQDMQPGRRESGRGQVAPKAAVEGAGASEACAGCCRLGLIPLLPLGVTARCCQSVRSIRTPGGPYGRSHRAAR